MNLSNDNKTTVSNVTKAYSITPTVNKQRKSNPKKKHKKKGNNSSPVEKAEHMLQVDGQQNQAGFWYVPKYDRSGMLKMIDNSSILPQCCSAYGSNIAGYGISLEYLDEYKDLEETEEMANEWKLAQSVLDNIYHEGTLADLFSNFIEIEEQIGVAYLEIMRAPNGIIQQIDIIREPEYIEKSRPSGTYVDVNYKYNGENKSYKKQFCKYRQRINGKTIYFKECGDMRVMDCNTGKYYNEVKYRKDTHAPYIEENGQEKDIAINVQANEILELKIGNEPYGKPRWIGTCLSIDGAWRAESLNNNYFRHGRHTPLLIMIEGGDLNEESRAQLTDYVNAIEGENGQHGFLVICFQSTTSNPMMGEEKPKITFKELGGILQKDELFQNYIDSNRKRVQSSFKLPDLYVGYTTDFNRATAQAAIEVTEKQIFQPRREGLGWFLNNKILDCYNFQYVRAKFNAPEITTVDDLVNLLRVAIEGNAISPNSLKNVIYAQLGLQAEAFPEDISEVSWADIPSNMFDKWISSVNNTVFEGFQKSIAKAIDDGANEEVIATLRCVMNELKKMIGDDNAENN